MTELKCKSVFNSEDITPKEKKITSLLIDFYEFIMRENGNTDQPIIHTSGLVSDNTNILITENKLLLSNRIKFEKTLNGNQKIGHTYPLNEIYPLNIANLQEANEIIDLFCKHKNGYFYGNTRTNEWLWYWYSFRIKVPFYHVNESLDASLADRFTFVLKCIDEMGKMYYNGVTNSTQKNLMYNFNHFISILTGLFDNLALITNEKYNIYEKNYEKEKITLNPNRNEFVNEIENHDVKLFDHIKNHSDFLNLAHILRNPIIHGKMFDMTFLKYNEIKLNTLIINNEILLCLRRIPKKINKTKRLEWWGVHGLKEFKAFKDKYFIEPYQFSKSAAEILIEFTNEYLIILGNTDFIKELEEKDKEEPDQFYRMMMNFKENYLGF